MSYKDFEEHLGDKLRNRSGDGVDNSSMWDKLEAELPPKKKRRRFILWWPLGIGFVVIGAFFLFREGTNLEQGIKKMTTEVKSNENENASTIKIEEADLAEAKIETKTNIILEDDYTAFKDPSNSEIATTEVTTKSKSFIKDGDKDLRKRNEEKDTGNKTSGTGTKKQLPFRAADDEIVKQGTNSNPMVFSAIENETRKTQQKDAVNKSDLATDEQMRKMTDFMKGVEYDKVEEAEKTLEKSEAASKTEKDESINKSTEIMAISEDVEKQAKEKLTGIVKVVKENEIGGVGEKDLGSENDDENKGAISIEKDADQATLENNNDKTFDGKDPNQTTIKKAKKNIDNRWGLGVSVGYYFALANYGGTDNPLIDLRKQNEDPLEALEALLSINFRLSEEWFLSSGVSCSRINQSGTTTKEFIEDRPGEVIVGEVNTVDGSYYITEAGMVPHKVRSTYRRYVSYSSLALPVQIQYAREIKNGWGISVNGGFEYSLMAWQSGYEQDLDGVEYNLSMDDSQRMNKRSSNYLLLGLRLQYLLSENVVIHLGGQSKYAISDLYQTTAFQKRYVLPGLTSGVLINF